MKFHLCDGCTEEPFTPLTFFQHTKGRNYDSLTIKATPRNVIFIYLFFVIFSWKPELLKRFSPLPLLHISQSAGFVPGSHNSRTFPPDFTSALLLYMLLLPRIPSLSTTTNTNMYMHAFGSCRYILWKFLSAPKQELVLLHSFPPSF